MMRTPRPAIAALLAAGLLHLGAALRPGLAAAYELTINFDDPLPASVGLSHADVPGRTALVASSLPGGGQRALRCFLPAGSSDDYCGLSAILAGFMPSRNDVYVRYHVKFEPNWQFATGNIYFKSLIFEMPAGTDYNRGGRTFLNFNTVDAGRARAQALLYSAGSLGWMDSGVDVANDGAWHAFEVHSYRNLADPANGRFQVWHNGVLVLDQNPVNAGDQNVEYLTFGYRNGAAQNDMYMQYDEIVIADHYIGPISNVPALAPARPKGLRIL